MAFHSPCGNKHDGLPSNKYADGEAQSHNPGRAALPEWLKHVAWHGRYDNDGGKESLRFIRLNLVSEVDGARRSAPAMRMSTS